jgi:hypothetical protein
MGAGTAPILIMVHTITPSVSRRADLMNSIANDQKHIAELSAIARAKLKENNVGENVLDPDQKNKVLDKGNHPLLSKLGKTRK